MPDQAGHDSRGGHPCTFLRRPYVFSPSSSTFLIEDPVSLSLLRFVCGGARPWIPDQGLSLTFFIEESGMTRMPPGACGRGCAPVPSIPYGGEDCLSAASSAAHTPGTGAQAPPWGPRPGATGFGSFCRNKRTSSCGGETPQYSPLVMWGRNPTILLPSSCGGETPHLVLREQESSYSASLSRNPYSRLVRATMLPVALS